MVVQQEAITKRMTAVTIKEIQVDLARVFILLIYLNFP